jgi:hypothetical protein
MLDAYKHKLLLLLLMKGLKMSDLWSEAHGFPAAEIAPATILGTPHLPFYRHVNLDGSDFHSFTTTGRARQHVRYISLEQSY